MPEVIVIGAGLAGIMAAYHACMEGADVIGVLQVSGQIQPCQMVCLPDPHPHTGKMNIYGIPWK